MRKPTARKPAQSAKQNKGSFVPPLTKQAFTQGPGVFSNFESAKFSNKREYIWASWPTDFKKTMTSFDRMETMRRMRWLELNSGLIREVMANMAMYSIGKGIMPQAQSGDEKWDDEAEKAFADWGRRGCDITGRFSFMECQHIMCRLMDRDGEVFIIKTKDAQGNPKIQLIEGHRVGNPTSSDTPKGMVDGVLFGKYGQPIGYNIFRSDGTCRLVPANAVIHLYEPEVASGARAYSPLQHSINNVVDMLEILSLEKFAVKNSSDITRTITRENPQFDGSQADFEAFGMRPQDYNGSSDSQQISTFIGGKVLALAPGEKLESFESNRPNNTFNGFLESLTRDSLAGTLPFEFVHDPTKAGGASVRLILAKAERRISHRQNVMISRAFNNIWGYVIGTFINNGTLKAIDTWNMVSWTTPKRITVDAGREAQQNRNDIKAGLKSISDHHLENGDDPRTKIREKFAEAAYMKQLEKEYDVPVSAVIMPENVSPQDVQTAYDGEPDEGDDVPESNIDGDEPEEEEESQ